jgi:hypothetical protein
VFGNVLFSGGGLDASRSKPLKVIGSASKWPDSASDATKIHLICLLFSCHVMVFLFGIACDFWAFPAFW